MSYSIPDFDQKVKEAKSWMRSLNGSWNLISSHMAHTAYENELLERHIKIIHAGLEEIIVNLHFREITEAEAHIHELIEQKGPWYDTLEPFEDV